MIGRGSSIETPPTVLQSLAMTTNTNALLDKARDLCDPATDYRLAKELGIDPSTIARCRRRNGTLDNKGVHALARFLEQPFEEVLALIELDREKEPKRRAYWEKVAPRLVPSLVIGLLAAASSGVSPASNSAGFQAGGIEPLIYILRSLVARLVRCSFTRLFTAPARVSAQFLHQVEADRVPATPHVPASCAPPRLAIPTARGFGETRDDLLAGFHLAALR